MAEGDSHSDRFRERFDVTGEPHGLPCGRQGTTKFEFKSPSVHSMVRDHPIAKSGEMLHKPTLSDSWTCSDWPLRQPEAFSQEHTCDFMAGM
ncbi:hypothetical protein E2C01_016121 [Portunus trituberculatus]|uniref:Uncharacterized protein n=1 Tax=Portunus trituberculatus TaxID=210409 RepID=A0A5B7DQ37_PORTR|nr:hypothetical protein [Portunus trituberculatus]